MYKSMFVERLRDRLVVTDVNKKRPRLGGSQAGQK